MALNPQYLDSLPNTLVDMYSLVEIDILEDMARRISTYDYFIPAAQHQNQKLQELGMTQQHIIKSLSDMTGQTQQEIIDLLTEAGEVAVADDVEYYKAADVYKPSKVNTEALHKQLNSGLLQTQQAFKNITATTANTATKQFENALDRAWTQINTGGMDYNTAISRAIKDLSEKGIGAIAYKQKNGREHVDSLEVAVRRAVVTGVNQTSLKIQETLADELDVDLVEVTAHGGARPEHAKWQGKCYSRNGRKVIDGVVYEDFKKATRYGHGDGLGGWNCRHNFHPYIHGAPRSWSDKALKNLDKKDIEYNGEKYSEYEANQIQRKIERGIRSLKRQVAAIEAGGGDASAERAMLRKANKSYTDFTKQTGLKKQTARTKIATGTGTERPDPNPPPPPKPTTKEFVPAKTIEAAEKQIKNLAKKVSFEGATNIDAVNSVNERLTALTTKYPVKNLKFISTDSELGRTAAQANHSSLAISTRFLNKLPKAIDWQKRIEKNPMHIEKFREQMMKVPKSERGKYERIIREHEKEMLFNRWTVSEGKSGLEQIKATITHEYGHIIADQYIGQVTRKEANPLFDWDNSNPLKAMQNKIVAALYKARQTGDIYKMSMYAEQDEYEFFAEAFTMYELGEPLPDYVENIVKEVLSFGTMQ